MEKREEVKNVVRKVDKLIHESFGNDNKTTITNDLLCDILKILVEDYNVNRNELYGDKNARI